MTCEGMPNEITPALKTYEALIRKLKERNVLVAKSVESAHGYRFENGILYLSYPQHLTNISARILMDSQHKPILDQAATAMSIQVVLE
jgi:hypothetical protein